MLWGLLLLNCSSMCCLYLHLASLMPLFYLHPWITVGPSVMRPKWCISLLEHLRDLKKSKNMILTVLPGFSSYYNMCCNDQLSLSTDCMDIPWMKTDWTMSQTAACCAVQEPQSLKITQISFPAKIPFLILLTNANTRRVLHLSFLSKQQQKRLGSMHC